MLAATTLLVLVSIAKFFTQMKVMVLLPQVGPLLGQYLMRSLKNELLGGYVAFWPSEKC